MFMFMIYFYDTYLYIISTATTVVDWVKFAHKIAAEVSSPTPTACTTDVTWYDTVPGTAAIEGGQEKPAKKNPSVKNEIAQYTVYNRNHHASTRHTLSTSKQQHVLQLQQVCSSSH